jgi:hypothetical protein
MGKGQTDPDHAPTLDHCEITLADMLKKEFETLCRKTKLSVKG